MIKRHNFGRYTRHANPNTDNQVQAIHSNRRLVNQAQHSLCCSQSQRRNCTQESVPSDSDLVKVAIAPTNEMTLASQITERGYTPGTWRCGINLWLNLALITPNQ